MLAFSKNYIVNNSKNNCLINSYLIEKGGGLNEKDVLNKKGPLDN